MIRYRTESAYGSYVRDAVEIMAYETFELNNSDILDYLLNHGLIKDSDLAQQCADYLAELESQEYIEDAPDDDGEEFFEEVLEEIQKVTGHKIKYALWLADLDRVKEFYIDDMTIDVTIDAYETGPVVLSDLGLDGTLYGYTEKPKPVETIKVD